MHTTSRCITPSVKRTPCGPRVLLSMFLLRLDAPAAEDRDLPRAYSEGAKLIMEISRRAEVKPLVKPDQLHFHLSNILPSI